MAWIETHQSLRLHTKTLNASTMLRCDRHKFLGHLMSLWWWGLDVADMDGNLPAGTTSGVIAAGAEWPTNKAREFVEALKTAGFLDEKNGRFMLHDWWDYAGKYNAKRAANKSRMRDARATHVQRTDGIRATHVQGLPVLPVQPDQPNQPVQPHQPPAAAADERIDALAAMFARYGTVTAGTPDAIAYSVEDYGLEWVERAVRVGAGSAVEGRPGWRYVESILERWQKQGGPDDDKPRVSPDRQFTGGVRDTSANATERAEARLRA